MVDAPRPARRRRLPSDDEILDAVVADLLAHGPLDWSLREAGTRIGVSARMLVHRFGSREELIGLAFDRLHEQHATAWLDASGSFELADLVAPDHRPVIRFMVQVGALALRHGGPYLRLWTAMLDDWVERVAALLVDAGFADEEARLRARSFVDAVRGVQFDVALSGDDEFGVDAVHLLTDRLFSR